MAKELGDQLKEWFVLLDEKERMSAEIRILNNELSELEDDILERMRAAKIDRADSEHGSVTRSSKMHPKVESMGDFLTWIMADRENRQHFLPRQANGAAVREFFGEQGLLPEGVTSYIKESLVSRRKNP